MGLLSKLKNPVKALTGSTLLNNIFNPHQFLEDQLAKLIQIPKPPSSIEIRGKQYNADIRFNEAALGDVKTVCYGLYKDWPRYRSIPYSMYVAHAQELNAYLHLSVGKVKVLSVNIGDTPVSTYPGIETEVLDPGEEMTLVLPNVYTCTEVTGIELLGGLPLATSPDGQVTVKFYETGTTTISASPPPGSPHFSSTTEAAFEDFIVGDVIYVYDAGANNGEYTILSIGDDFSSIVVSPAPASSTTQSAIGFFVRQRWTGGFWACPPGSQIEDGSIDIDFAALWDEDGISNVKNVDFELQYREGDDAGNFLGSWAAVDSVNGVAGGDFTLSDNVRRPRRFTVPYTLPSPMRAQLRLWRASREGADDETSKSDWSGLKGYIIPLVSDDPTVDDDSTDMAIKVRASGLLSQNSQRSVNYFGQRQLPIWDSGGFTAEQDTRNPVWAYVDWVREQSSDGIVTADLDMAEISDLAAFADSNVDTFDGVFDTQVGLWEGAKTLLRVVRAKPIKDPLTGLYTVYRDEPADPVLMFCDGFNSRCGTDAISLPDADTPTGVKVKFTDPFLWSQREGPLVGDSTDPREVEFMGCTTWAKAWDEAQYEYRDLYYRNQTVTVETEMEGLLPRHGKRVLVCSAAKGWGQAGEVIAQDGTDPLILTVRPPPVFTPGMTHYVYLQDADGTPVGPITVTDLGTNFIQLASDPGITYRTDGRWPTLFAFGHDGDVSTDPDAPRVAIVQKRPGKGARTATLELLFDHAYVHEDPGAPPDDPYSLTGTIPDLAITNLTAEAVYSGTIDDEDGNPILDEDGMPLLDESEVFGIAINVDWDDVSGASYYSLRWKYVGIPGWHVGYVGIASQATFGVEEAGDIQIRVKAFSGSYIGPESSTTITVVAPAGSP